MIREAERYNYLERGSPLSACPDTSRVQMLLPTHKARLQNSITTTIGAILEASVGFYSLPNIRLPCLTSQKGLKILYRKFKRVMVG